MLITLERVPLSPMTSRCSSASCRMKYYFKTFWFFVTCHPSFAFCRGTRTNEGRIRQSFIIYKQRDAALCCKCWQRTDSFELECYQGRPCALLTVIKTRISNAVLTLLPLKWWGMLDLDQQWLSSSWWSSRLLQKWCSSSTMLRTVLMHRLEQVGTAWIFYAFAGIDGLSLRLGVQNQHFHRKTL